MDIRVSYNTSSAAINYPAGEYTAANGKVLADDIAISLVNSGAAVVINLPAQASSVLTNAQLANPLIKAPAGVGGGKTYDENGEEISLGESTISTAVDRPYLIVPFGDSRATITGENNNTSGNWSGLSADTGNMAYGVNCVLTNLVGLMEDAEVIMDFANSGESPNAWNTRSVTNLNRKAIQYLTTSKDVDAVYYQYGINGVMSYGGSGYATLRDQQIGYLKASVMEIIKAGIFVIYDSMWPIWAAGSLPTLTDNYTAEKNQMVYEINATMKAFIDSMPNAAKYIDSTPFINGGVPNGPALASTLPDGIHLSTENNARNLARYLLPQIRAIFPKKSATFFARNAASSKYPNLLNLTLMTQFNGSDQNGGSATGYTYTSGIENGEYWYQLEYTPTGLNSGQMRSKFELHANVGGSNGTPFNTLYAGDLLQASYKVIVDDGFGGVSDVVACSGRLQVNYATSTTPGFSWANTEAGTVQSDPLPVEKIKKITPTLLISSSGSADIAQPAVNTGLRLVIYARVNQITGKKVRIRVYSPMIREVSDNPRIAVKTNTGAKTLQATDLVDIFTGNKNIFTNTGATAMQVNTLPPCYEGAVVRFFNNDADGIRITAVGDDTIQLVGVSTSAAGSISSTTVNAYIELTGLNNNTWVATSQTGTWATP